jgi:hypothetical protein
MLFFGAQYAITGFQFNLGNVSQTLAGYLFPGKPLGTFPLSSLPCLYSSDRPDKHVSANMYFTSYTFNAVQQGQYLLRDLKLAQQTKLSPKCTFATQVIGCIFGACLNYAMMIS